MATRGTWAAIGFLVGVILVIVILLAITFKRSRSGGSISSSSSSNVNCQSDKYQSLPDPTTGRSFTCDPLTGMEKKQKKAIFANQDCADIKEFPNCVCAMEMI